MNSSRVTACALQNEQAATLLEFMYHSQIVLSVSGSVWYMIRNLRCTVTTDSVLANSKTQNSFLFTVNAIFCHDYPLAVEPGSTPRPLVQKKIGEILYLLIWSFVPCLSWLLRCQVWKSGRDLWITLYFKIISYNFHMLVCILHLTVKILCFIEDLQFQDHEDDKRNNELYVPWSRKIYLHNKCNNVAKRAFCCENGYYRNYSVKRL